MGNPQLSIVLRAGQEGADLLREPFGGSPSEKERAYWRVGTLVTLS